jgi:hypothetical protein
MESEVTFSFIDYAPDDYYLLEAWCTAHDRRPPLPEALPAVGIIVMNEEAPTALLFLYLDVTSSVGIVDWVITRPGLSVNEARAVLLYASEGPLTDLAREAQCTMLTCYTPKGIALQMEKHGWTTERREIFNMSKML